MTMLYKNASVWNGLPADEMAEINTLVQPTKYKSPRRSDTAEVKPSIERKRGKVVTLTDRGFGFISPGRGMADVYFHLADVSEDSDIIKRGDYVSFVPVNSGGKLAAKDVRLA